MAEGIAGRVGRIISGGVNALVDAVEGAAPEMVLEEAMREVDRVVDDVRAELGKAIAAKHLAGKRLAEKKTKHETLGSQIEVAVAEQRDDLAEAAISHQLDIEAQIPVLEQSIAETGEREKELEGYIAALQARKREMKEELAEFKTARAKAESTTGDADELSGGVGPSVDKANATFERVMDNSLGVMGRTPPDAKTANQLQELEQLSRQNRVKERLAALKSGMSE
ncbi:PspA/IM30 family protein [Magnetospira sp. QH-2]|uniref:PspA/IM30 family protein n=1 Tax=Magnetospira sp. (strain QH-2) TaxID=1288970 RepID=UPI0003E81BC8|nr:PspA/IM30 family protein [Magnetospira sp. QH-2]CCQ74391.1 PspA\